MSDYFRDFVHPVKIIFDRLQQQKELGVTINGNNGKPKEVSPPFYPNLPEYPCKLIRGAGNKVVEIQYGEDPRGYVWRQLIHRDANGRVDYIKQENPDGSFDITFHRDSYNRVDLINVE